MPETEMAAAPTAQVPRSRLRRIASDLVLRCHRTVERLDALPAEFGKAGSLDETDAQALITEWRRCLKAWADYNPEEVFALKVGAVLLGVALATLWMLVALLR